MGATVQKIVSVHQHGSSLRNDILPRCELTNLDLPRFTVSLETFLHKTKPSIVTKIELRHVNVVSCKVFKELR